MTADVVTVEPGLPIGELAQHMIDAGVHRVVVLDPEGRPVGVVCSTDVLAALARWARYEKEVARV
jgi:CBS-domain-containing membrane protein